MSWIFLGLAIIAGAIGIQQMTKPNIIVLPPVGPVIFNPAPETGSNTFLGSITGIPGTYWNITPQISDVPSNFIQMPSSK